MQECDQFVYDNRLSTAALPPSGGSLRIPPALCASRPGGREGQMERTTLHT
jgi:hypothetical protein